MYQHNTQVGWLQLAPIFYCHIVPLADVVDVHRYAGISTWRAEDRRKHVKNCAYIHIILPWQMNAAIPGLYVV